MSDAATRSSQAEDLVILATQPLVAETPLGRQVEDLTPNARFFIRNHFNIPVLDRRTWQLRLGGSIRRPVTVTLADLERLPRRTLAATVECAGNARSFFPPPTEGNQFGYGAVSAATWTGVSLRDLLGPDPFTVATREVLFIGADRGFEKNVGAEIAFERSLPVEIALHPDTLLVFEMNGEPLPVDHGAPVRLLVPGWYGVASVKWLRRIEVINRPFHGYYQSVKYTVQRATPSGTETVVVGPMAVKSELIRPAADSEVGIGTNRLFGVAWAGEESVARVEVSTDAGRTWNPADLIGPQTPYSWTPWEYLWEVAEPGEYSLLTRAISSSGHIQPTQHDPLHGGYLIHFSRPIPVRVQAGLPAQAQRGDIETLLYDMNAYAEENTRNPLDVELEFAAGGGI